MSTPTSAAAATTPLSITAASPKANITINTVAITAATRVRTCRPPSITASGRIVRSTTMTAPSASANVTTATPALVTTVTIARATTVRRRSGTETSVIRSRPDDRSEAHRCTAANPSRSATVIAPAVGARIMRASISPAGSASAPTPTSTSASTIADAVPISPPATAPIHSARCGRSVQAATRSARTTSDNRWGRPRSRRVRGAPTSAMTVMSARPASRAAPDHRARPRPADAGTPARVSPATRPGIRATVAPRMRSRRRGAHPDHG